MSPFIVYVGMAVVAIIFRFGLGFTQGCLYIGKTISDTDSKTGFQDAVTPPFLSNMMIMMYILIVAFVVFAFWGFGIRAGIVVIFEFVGITLITAAVTPKPNSGYWVKQVHRSLLRRVADYAKANDHMRSQAAQVLAERIEQRLADKLTSQPLG